MGNRNWKLPGLNVDWTQEAQVDREWTGYVDGRFADGSRWDPSRGSSREYVWVDEANCAGVDPELFQVAQKGDPEVEGMNHTQVTKYNREKIEAARSTCEGCPVRQQCLDEATPVDRFWSVRGGELPKKMSAKAGDNRPPSWDMSDYDELWCCKKHGTQFKVIAERVRKGKTFRYYECGGCKRGSA